MQEAENAFCVVQNPVINEQVRSLLECVHCFVLIWSISDDHMHYFNFDSYNFDT